MRPESVSENTSNAYVLPESSIDPDLDKFIYDTNNSYPVVAVQGLGFVGLAMSLVVANSESKHYRVIGVDQATEDSFWKICEINKGICPVKSSDPLFEEYFNTAHSQRNFYATHDCRAYQHADVIIVDINLDVDKKHDCAGSLSPSDVPLSAFKEAIRMIGQHCKENVLLIVETTVPPGTCNQIVKPIIAKQLKERGLRTDGFSIGHSYERVMPGPNYINSIKNFYRVYSGIDPESASRTKSFLMSVISTDEYPLTQLANTEATEMAKVLENSYRAMNIAFMVEWSRFAEAAGVNIYEVVKAIRARPTHSNIMLPGIGVGGYCLTKDPVMASWASREFFGIEDGLGFSLNAVEVNDQMPDFAFEFCKQCIFKLKAKVSKISLLGVAYAPGIGDTRFSPVEPFAKHLIAQKFAVEYHDPYVSYWKEMSVSVEVDMNNLTSDDTDVIIVTTGHQNYINQDMIYIHLRNLPKKPILIDTVGLLDPDMLGTQYKIGVNYFVLGVGS